MAISAATVWEVRASTGNDNNGGGFVAGAAGTDRSQQSAAQVVIDNSTITTSITANVITFTGYTPTSADVGNIVQFLTGTNVTANSFYQITAQTATTWTVTGAVNLPTSGTTVNATGNMGGALATLNKLSGAMVASNKAFATGAFTTTSTIVFAQSVTTPSGSIPASQLIGYGSSRRDGVHATLTLQTNTGLIGMSMAAGWLIDNMDVNCSSLGTSQGINLVAKSAARSCKVQNFTSQGINLAGTASDVSDCELTGGTAAATNAIGMPSGNYAYRCNIHDNACPGIAVGNFCTVTGCLIVNNSGASSDGIQVGSVSTGVALLNNTIHGNGRDGVRVTTAEPGGLQIRNNIITSNGGAGLNATGTAIPAAPDYDGNAYFNNTSGARTGVDSTAGIFAVNPYTNVLDVTLAGSPYVGPTTGSTANFGLNTTAGGGLAARGAGTPQTWPGNTGTTGAPDMGAAQSSGGGRGGQIMVVQGGITAAV